MEKCNYQYDVFLSWTNANRSIKNRFKQMLLDTTFKGRKLTVFDSEDASAIVGYYPSEQVDKVYESKVYVLFLSDALMNDPLITGKGKYSECITEAQEARQAEKEGRLKVVCFNLSCSIFYKEREDMAPHEKIFYGVSMFQSCINAVYGEDGEPNAETMDDLLAKTLAAVADVEEGKHIRERAATDKFLQRDNLAQTGFVGRTALIEETLHALTVENPLPVALWGIGGIGKSSLAARVAELASERGLLDCPQIASLSETVKTDVKDSKRFLDGIRFTDSFYQYRMDGKFDEEEKRRRKLAVLNDLPGRSLLVIDNFNDVGEGALDILQKLPCRVLITCRENPKRTASVPVLPIRVDSLDETDARELFLTQSGLAEDNCAEDDFHALFEHVGGHTKAICLFARLVQRHKKAIGEVLKEMNSIETMNELVPDADREDKIANHLTALFKMGDFSDDSKFILKNLCLVAEGMLPERDLAAITAEDGQPRFTNGLFPLEDAGWVERRTVNGTEYIALHPLLSEIAYLNLNPSEQDVPRLVAYLKERAEKQFKEGVSYDSARTEADALFFAIRRLSRGGRLCRTLWEVYCEYSRALGTFPYTEEQCEVLLAGGTLEKEDAQAVRAYRDMLVLEQDPSRTELLEPYLDHLYTASDDYAWVSRQLSVCAAPLLANKSAATRTRLAIEHALRRAAEQKDDVAVFSLSAYALLFGGTQKTLPFLRTYLRERRKEHKQNGEDPNGSYLFLKYYEAVFHFAPKMTPDTVLSGEYFEKLAKSTQQEAGIGNTLKMFLAHPLSSFRIVNAETSARFLPEDDPFFYFFLGLENFSVSLADGTSVDVEQLYRAFMALYEQLAAKGLTYQDVAQVTSSFIVFIRRALPASMQFEFSSFAQNALRLPQRLTMQELDKLRANAMIVFSFGSGNSVIVSAKNLLESARLSHMPADEYYDMSVDLGERLYEGGERNLAIGLYGAAMKWYRENSPKSKTFHHLLSDLLQLRAKEIGWDGRHTYSEIFDLYLAGCEPYDINAVYAYEWYLARRFELLDLIPDKDLLTEAWKETTEDLLARLGTFSKDIMHYTKEGRTRILGCYINFSTNRESHLHGEIAPLFPRLDAMLRGIVSRSRGEMRDRAKLARLLVKTRENYGDVEAKLNFLRFAVKKKMDFGNNVPSEFCHVFRHLTASANFGEVRATLLKILRRKKLGRRGKVFRLYEELFGRLAIPNDAEEIARTQRVAVAITGKKLYATAVKLYTDNFLIPNRLRKIHNFSRWAAEAMCVIAIRSGLVSPADRKVLSRYSKQFRDEGLSEDRAGKGLAATEEELKAVLSDVIITAEKAPDPMACWRAWLGEDSRACSLLSSLYETDEYPEETKTQAKEMGGADFLANFTKRTVHRFLQKNLPLASIHSDLLSRADWDAQQAYCELIECIFADTDLQAQLANVQRSAKIVIEDPPRRIYPT